MADSAQAGRALLQTGLKFGLVGSVIAIGLFFAMQALGENPLIWTSPKLIAYSVLFLFFPLLATVEFRRYHLVGKWKFWQGLVLGILVYGTICILTLVVAVIVMQVDTSLVESYRETSLQTLEGNREGFVEQFSEERYEQTKEMVLATTAWEIALDDFLKKLLLGFFLTVTTALALSIISSLRARSVPDQ